MTSDLDIYRSAHVLIQQHGEAAAMEGDGGADLLKKFIDTGPQTIRGRRGKIGIWMLSDAEHSAVR